MLRAKRAAGLSPQSVNHIRTVMATALAHAERRRLVATNAARLSEPEHVPHAEVAYLLPEQVERLLASMLGEPLGPLVTLAIYTGLRQGELLGLRWRDVDLDAGTLRVAQAIQNGVIVETKTTASRRRMMLPAVAVAALRRQRVYQGEQRLLAGRRWMDNGLIFTTGSGHWLQGGYVTKVYQQYLHRARLPKTRFHDLRHTHASLLIHLGLAPRLVMERLGHSTIATTMDIYGHIYPEAEREAARLLDHMFDTAVG
jgi:integrase